MGMVGNFRSDIISTVVLTGSFFYNLCWNKTTLIWCALASLRFTSAFSWDRLPGVQRDWYQRAGVDSSALVPVVMGVAVCQGQCESPLCSSAAAWYERERGPKTDLNTALWLGTQRKAALSNHTPNFDWRVQFCSGSLFKRWLSDFITSNKTQGTNQVIAALRCATTPDDSTCEPGLLRWHVVHSQGSFCLPFHLNGNAPRMSFNKLPRIDNCFSRQHCELNWMSEFQLKASGPGIAHWEMQTEFLW